jgi:hypothetical protein
MTKRRKKMLFSQEELLELRDRYGLAYDRKQNELLEEFRQIRDEILARRGNGT